MSEILDLDAVERLAASATPGPWSWNVNPRGHTVSLDGRGRGNEVVMGFRRWGMGGAQPTFRKCHESEGKVFHLLADVGDFLAPIDGREHHASWLQDIDQPDARFIAAARTLVPALTAELRAARERIAGLEADAARWRAVAPRMTAIDFNYACGDDQTEQVAIVFLPKGERWKLDAGLIADKLIAIDTARTATPRTESECPRCGQRTHPDDAHTCSPQGRAEEGA